MPEIELITEQHGIDEDGNHWILDYAGEPKRWKLDNMWRKPQAKLRLLNEVDEAPLQNDAAS